MQGGFYFCERNPVTHAKKLIFSTRKLRQRRIDKNGSDLAPCHLNSKLSLEAWHKAFVLRASACKLNDFKFFHDDDDDEALFI